MIDKFESCLPFITVGKHLSPIVQAIKSKYHFKQEEIFDKTEIFYGTLELDSS